MKNIEFYFDFISPYSYLGWIEMLALRERYALAIQPVPILFAGLLNHWGQKGPAEIIPKRIHVFKDIIRRAARLNLSLQFPPVHPFNPLLPLRLATALSGHPQQTDIITRIYHACWRYSQDITEAKVLENIMAEAGIDKGAEILALCGTSEIKDKLKRQTDDALKLGVFGVPSIKIDHEIFWGHDQISSIEEYLMGRDPVQKADLNQYLQRPQKHRN